MKVVHNEQYMTALAHANEIRTYRARLKRDIKAGRESAYGIVAVPPQLAQTMHVFDVLLAMPYTGRVKADRLLRRCGVPRYRTLADLSERQRAELLALLPQRMERRAA